MKHNSRYNTTTVFWVSSRINAIFDSLILNLKQILSSTPCKGLKLFPILQKVIYNMKQINYKSRNVAVHMCTFGMQFS